MVDTGAACSIFPEALLPGNATSTGSQTKLPSVGGGVLYTKGEYETRVDLGFARTFHFNFFVAELKYGILGADFLTAHHLGVDMASRQLFLSSEVEQSPPPDPEPQVVGKQPPQVSSGDSQDDILQFLKREYPEVFEAVKRSRLIKHSVVATVETETDEPIAFRARRLAPDKFSALKHEISRLVTQGILEESQSLWAFPIVMVPKTDPGKYRLCADFVALNKVLKVKKYALPNVLDFASMASGCEVFSSIDIKDAYYMIPVSRSDSDKLTITTPIGNYRYRFLPMGLSSSSTYFQRLMNEVLAGIPQVFAYLDDIIVMSSNLEEHIRLLKLVFDRLRLHGLVVNQDKCVFAVSSLKFLGHRVSVEGLSPLEDKAQGIVEYAQPRTKRQLRRFVGMVQFYAKFIPRCAELLQPLYDVIARGPTHAPLNWTQEEEKCFQETKTALVRSVTLAYPSPQGHLELFVDASEKAIGAVLQQAVEGERQPLAFWSKSLDVAQQKWSCYERELYACYASIRHFQYMLDARLFTLYTDHRPVVNRFYSRTSPASPRQSRHLDFIAQFTNDVRHVAGPDNVADALLRPVEPPVINAILPELPSIDYLHVALAQRRDAEISLLRRDNDTSLDLEELPLADHGIHILCDVSQSSPRPVIPQSLRFRIFKIFHGLAHPGQQGSIKIISRIVVWKGMRKDIARWARECQECARAKVHRHNKAPLQPVEPSPKESFSSVYVDLTGPLPPSRGYAYLMVVVDRFSRFFQAIPLKGITAEECASALTHHWISFFGCPTDIFCDRGTQFTSTLWKQLCDFLGCRLHHSTAYHPQAQGTVERVNRTLKTALKCYDDPSGWFDNLPWVLLALRNSPKQDMNWLSPNEVVFGRPLRLPSEFFEPIGEGCPSPSHRYVAELGERVAAINFYPPRHATKPSHVDPKLLDSHTTHVYVRQDAYRPPLRPAYFGPVRILERDPKYFVLDFVTHSDRVSIDRLKAAYLGLESLNGSPAGTDQDGIESGWFQGNPMGTRQEDNRSTQGGPVADTLEAQEPSEIRTSSPGRRTLRGRSVRTPTRFKDYELT